MFKRFIGDGFGIFEDTQNEVEYLIYQFNLLRKTIKIDKWSYGTYVEHMNLEIPILAYHSTSFWMFTGQRLQEMEVKEGI